MAALAERSEDADEKMRQKLEARKAVVEERIESFTIHSDDEHSSKDDQTELNTKSETSSQKSPPLPDAVAAHVLPPSPEKPEWHSGLQEGGLLKYKSGQGVLFLKRDEDPRSKQIVKLRWPAGKLVYSTGMRWIGPSGGVWAELEASKDEHGWALVEGPGFGYNGPILLDPEKREEMMMVRVMYLGQTKDETKVVYERLVEKTQLVGTYVKRFAKQCNLNPKLIMLTKGLPAKQPNGTGMTLPADYIKHDDLLNADRSFASYDELEFRKEVLLYLVYVGYWEDYRAP